MSSALLNEGQQNDRKDRLQRASHRGPPNTRGNDLHLDGQMRWFAGMLGWMGVTPVFTVRFLRTTGPIRNEATLPYASGYGLG